MGHRTGPQAQSRGRRPPADRVAVRLKQALAGRLAAVGAGAGTVCPVRRVATASTCGGAVSMAAPHSAASGYLLQSLRARLTRPRLLVRNATSHADPHCHGCPSASAMQHSGGADVTVALTVSHELLNSKHKSSLLCQVTVAICGVRRPGWESSGGRISTRLGGAIGRGELVEGGRGAENASFGVGEGGHRRGLRWFAAGDVVGERSPWSRARRRTALRGLWSERSS